MMEMTVKCPECGSAISVHPDKDAGKASCNICNEVINLGFTSEHVSNSLTTCPYCKESDFYSQKDFSRFIGVGLFIIASIISIWTYGMSFVVLYLVDYFLFQKLGVIAICYHCQSIFRKVHNIEEIPSYDHEKNDRIVYNEVK